MVRRITAALAATGIAATLSVAMATPAAAERFISAEDCYISGGWVVLDLSSPSLTSCSGGEYDGFWVVYKI
ncbi:hypothetical protein [Salinactinospora qingdaonensis]|uniref:Uncharacterized protein n=1 Tax=Salinactinospora qingdaonensis TaxID=702744 RepID=A0ABP7FB76_9ACTN